MNCIKRNIVKFKFLNTNKKIFQFKKLNTKFLTHKIKMDLLLPILLNMQIFNVFTKS